MMIVKMTIVRWMDDIKKGYYDDDTRGRDRKKEMREEWMTEQVVARWTMDRTRYGHGDGARGGARG